MKKRKKRISPENKVRLEIINLLKAAKPISHLSVIRSVISPDNYKIFYEELEKYPNSLSKIVNGEVPRRMEDFGTSTLLPIPIENEISWARTVLLKNVKYLKHYIQLSEQFSGYLLQGKYPEAAMQLNAIEESFGQSLWLVKNKTAFLQLTEGLESQKKYTQNIKRQLKFRSLVAFICHWVSIRNENSITINRFSSQIKSIVSGFHPVKMLGYKEYCNYHLLNQEAEDPNDFINVLRFEFSRSLIDYYEAFVALMRVISVSNSDSLKNKVNYFIGGMIEQIPDQRLKVLNEILKNTTQKLTPPEESIKSSDLFFAGSFNESHDIANIGLEKNPDDPLLIYLLAQAKAMLPLGSTKDDKITDDKKDTVLGKPINELVIFNLAKVISNGIIAASREINDLKKLALNFPTFPWAAIIDLLVLKEVAVFSNQERNSLTSVLRIPYFHPLLQELVFNSNIKDQYNEACSRACEPGLSLDFSMIVSSEDEDFDLPFNDLTKHLLSGTIAYKKQNFDKAIECGRFLGNQNFGYYKRRGYGLISHSLFFSDQLEQACENVANFYLQDINIYPILPLAQIVEAIKPGTKEWKKVHSMIDFSIILDAYVKYIGKDAEAARRFAYEDFLNQNGFKRPSELRQAVSKFNLPKLIYYLRFICVEANMDTSMAFEGGSEEVVAERLAVCKLLLSIDENNAEVYNYEINQIVRTQIIESRMQEIDQSRIYVDLKSVKEWAVKELEENYNRYITYLKHGLDSEEKEDVATNYKKFDGGSSLRVPENDANALLSHLVNEIIDGYVSADFGLDRFLSTRIRHGVLENHLRRPIEAHKLITKKEHKGGHYLTNIFWIKKIEIEGQTIAKTIEKEFAIFSEAYDNLISEINDDWIQIDRGNKPSGLLKFSASKEEIKAIGSVLSKDTSLSAFIDLVIDSLENLLVLNLLNIRDELNRKAKRNAVSILNKLQVRLSTLEDEIDISKLDTAINKARTDIQEAFNQVIEWFVPPSTGNSAPYTIEDAIYVAEALIQTGTPEFKVNFDNRDEESQIKIHGRLPTFIDIFVNLFENVVKRSGLELPSVNVVVWTDSTIENLLIFHFSVTNEIKKMDLQWLKNHLKRKKELLQSGNYKQFLATEGNSGLFKVYRSVVDFRAMGFDVKSTMDFGVENENFFVKLAIPFRVFPIESEEAEFVYKS